MFSLLGSKVARYWPAVIGAWCALLALGWLVAPDWETVTRSGEVEFLPKNAPSRQGDALFREAFPDSYSGSSVVVVLTREAQQLTEQDRKFVEEELSSRLWDLTESHGGQQPVATRVRTLEDPGVGALLVSPDRRATLALVELETAFVDRRNTTVVAQVEGVLAELREAGKIPEGLDVHVSGSATAGRDLGQAQLASVRAIEIWTIVAVVALLLLLYRAPLVALVPLVTVFFAVQVSLRLLALLAWFGLLAPDRDLRIFITVLVYGAGVDYCLFLVGRFREGLDAGHEPPRAIAEAIGGAGHAVCASAATVIFGIGALSFASFGKIREAGLTIPIALTVTTCAALTLGPALLRAAGCWSFWPQIGSCAGAPDPRPGLLRSILAKHWLENVWVKLGPVLLRRPGTIWLACLVLLVPFALVALWRYDDQNYNPVSDLPRDAPSVTGTQAASEHYPPGVLVPVTLLVRDDDVDFAHSQGIKLVERVTDRLSERRDELGLVDVRSVAKPLGVTAAAEEGLADVPGSRKNAPAAVRRRAISHYVSQGGGLKGHVTRIDLSLEADPFSRRALGDLGRVEDAVREDLPEALRGAQVYATGPTASARDLATVKRSDQTRIQWLVPAVVFALLLLVFRRVVVSLYLVLSVVFSYLATLGATILVFWLLDPGHFAGLDWKVPIFLFTILVAVGEDYNVFLVTRIKEEQARHGPVEGITTALARTGRVISACGFIMAGTFASLLSGSLLGMKQLGFALALGVLLDTLVVRPVLVPAFLILLQTGRLGRFGRASALGREEPAPGRAA
jgi:RND superfamily putative drug exporter